MKRFVGWLVSLGIVLGTALLFSSTVSAQQAGSIRGTVLDADFDAPLPAAEIWLAETGQKVQTSDEGNYSFGQIDPGSYTVVFSKSGFTQQVKTDVVVSPGQITDLNVSLSGEFAEMEEFIVQDLQIGGGTEAGLLQLRMESPALLDSISSDLMSKAGASDAASALNLVSGATVQDGKFAVVRGLPDRYVNSQMNAVRLPTADAEKRAVELDQFPSAVIESVQVSKTFTPDQQGDASGGAVNVVLKGIPEENVFKVKAKTTYNTQSSFNDDFLTYKNGGVGVTGRDDGSRDLDDDFSGAVGTKTGDAPYEMDFAVTAGGKKELEYDLVVGGFANAYYKRGASFYDNGIDDDYWVETPGGGVMTPERKQDTASNDYKTALYDKTEGKEEVSLGGLAVIGVEYQEQSLDLIAMHTRVTTDEATLVEDTRGKQTAFPDYDLNDMDSPGYDQVDEAPYIRQHTLKYTERTTNTIQFKGDHKLPLPEIRFGDAIEFLPHEIDWTVARSEATLNQPDTRTFGTIWQPEQIIPARPPFIPEPTVTPAKFLPLKPDANANIGNVSRVWKEITEESQQYFVNWQIPFKQWTEDEGYFKFGVFHDQVDRTYDQDTFSNPEDPVNEYEGEFSDSWARNFNEQVHFYLPQDIDVDYIGEQEISAWYYMVDLPLWSEFKLVGGVRYEKTRLSTVVFPEKDVTWIPPGTDGKITQLNPGDADVNYSQDDVLPAISFEFKPFEDVTLRGAYTETVARQTFRELTPIQQTEFAGDDIFVGNPDLRMSSLKNYDVRLDYTPFDGGMISFSWFFKDITDPIEYVQRGAGGSYPYETPVNYPEGELKGYEIEVRQELGEFVEDLEGLSVGGNATFIDSFVRLPQDEIERFLKPNIQVPFETRDMTGAPEYLYNFFVTYELEKFGTSLSMFYTVKGDTLKTGAGQLGGNFLPSIYEKEFRTLNFTLSQELNETFKLTFQAKNLLNDEIQEVYRSDAIGGDVIKESYTKGIDYSLSLDGKW